MKFIKYIENKLTVTSYVQNVHHWHEHKHASMLAIGQLRHQSATAQSLATHAADAVAAHQYHEHVSDVIFTSHDKTRHRASTSMYSLTFCIRFLLPERHQWKCAVQTAAVMLRRPPVGGRSLAGRPRPLPVCGAQFWGPRRPPASGARRPRPAGRSHYVVISRDGRKLVTGSRYVAIATQPVPRLQIRPIVHN